MSVRLVLETLCVAALVLATACHAAIGEEPVRFSRQVLPLLADRCFRCHGPDASEREADLRLDKRDSATKDRGGYAVIDPGNPDASELVARITSATPISKCRRPTRTVRNFRRQKSKSSGGGLLQALPGESTGPSKNRSGLLFQLPISTRSMHSLPRGSKPRA